MKEQTDRKAGFSFMGHCLCGAITLQISHHNPTMSACHCGICRRWGGGPFLTIDCHHAPEIQGVEHVRIYASSEWAERGFCGQCGTHLFYRLIDGGLYAFPVGLFDEGVSWPFDMQVFVDKRPDNYRFANDTKEMTSEEVFKQWGA